MQAQGFGRIINFSSISGLRAFPTRSAYCTSKFAVVGLTKTLAIELAKAALNQSRDVPVTVGLEYESVAQAILFESDDKEEGMSALLEKRKPGFRGG